ncbi:MAG: hypothetical protein ACI87E_000954 [Mariniblastus sp.]|jgi:hypothetical protein
MVIVFTDKRFAFGGADCRLIVERSIVLSAVGFKFVDR